MAQLIIIRGLPGSGKSTMAKQNYPNHIHVEADMWFTSPAGDYMFIPKELPRAHEWCIAQVRYSLSTGRDVVVSNTFTQKWEMQPYLDLGYPTEIITAIGNWPNVHGVPEHAIAKMRARWED